VAREPLLNFFIERYQEAYAHQINAFIEVVASGQTPTPDFEDGRRALLLADAANESLRSGRVVKLSD
jgi:myo-inositol 2-dehydrogenase/D-chiro-inositol 1-dehydrogenase